MSSWCIVHGSSHTFKEYAKKKSKDQEETMVIREWKMCLQKRDLKKRKRNA